MKIFFERISENKKSSYTMLIDNVKSYSFSDMQLHIVFGKNFKNLDIDLINNFKLEITQ